MKKFGIAKYNKRRPGSLQALLYRPIPI